LPPSLEIKLEVKRKEGGKTETLTAKLAEVPDTIPAKLPEEASAKKALVKPGMPPAKEDKKEEEKKAETGLLKRATAAADHTYYIYVPENYDPNIAYSLVIWFHPPNKGKEKDLDNFTFNTWSTYCEDQKTIMLCPVADNQNNWTPSEADFILEAVKAVTDAYTIDRKRIVVHGMGVGGQMALYLGFQNRALVRGVATVGAALTANPKEKVANQPVAFFLATGSRDPLKDAVKETKAKLGEFKYPVYFKEIQDRGHEYLDLDTVEELVRWIDSLDRI
jgi:poly(3-hydroxybutyrate) depolymerase